MILPPQIPAIIEGDAKSKRIHEVFSEARAKGQPSISGRMWAYRSLSVPINVFDFTVSRHRDGPGELLVAGNFTGTIMVDCYSGYQGISLRSEARITRAACNAHARRKVFETRAGDPLLAARFLAMSAVIVPMPSTSVVPTAAARQAPLAEHVRHSLMALGGAYSPEKNRWTTSAAGGRVTSDIMTMVTAEAAKIAAAGNIPWNK